MLSGPRRSQAGSHLPKIRPDTRRGESRKRPTTGPCGELATHFMGLLVCAETYSRRLRRWTKICADRIFCHRWGTDAHRWSKTRILKPEIRINGETRMPKGNSPPRGGGAEQIRTQMPQIAQIDADSALRNPIHRKLITNSAYF